MAGDRRPNPDTSVASFPERAVYCATGPGRRIVGLGEVGEDEVFEPVRGQLHGGIGRLTVREMTMLRGDPALQARRVRAPPEPVEIVVRLEYDGLRPAHASQYLDTGLP